MAKARQFTQLFWHRMMSPFTLSPIFQITTMMQMVEWWVPSKATSYYFGERKATELFISIPQNRYWFSPAMIRNMWTEYLMHIFDCNLMNCRKATWRALCSKANEMKSKPMDSRQPVCSIMSLTTYRLKGLFSSTAHGTRAKAFTKIHESTNYDRSCCSIGWRNFGATRGIVRVGSWRQSKVNRNQPAENFNIWNVYLIRVSAIHQFLMEVHINAWGLDRSYRQSLQALEIDSRFIDEGLIVESKMDSGDGPTEPYNGQYDNLLFFYSHIHQLIHKYYDRIDSKTARRPLQW